MDWYDVTGKYHMQTLAQERRLSALPEEWQRELAAIWRLEADVNNGAYLQFLANWGRESYVYASQALRKIGARQMFAIVERCQALVDEHFNSDVATPEQLQQLVPIRVLASDGTIKEPTPILPNDTVEEIYALSYEFMDYPEDLASLGLGYYANYLKV